MTNAFEIEEETHSMEQFNEKRAKQAYKNSMSTEADYWVSQIHPYDQEEKIKPAMAKTEKESFDISEALEILS